MAEPHDSMVRWMVVRHLAAKHKLPWEAANAMVRDVFERRDKSPFAKPVRDAADDLFGPFINALKRVFRTFSRLSKGDDSDAQGRQGSREGPGPQQREADRPRSDAQEV